MRRAISLLLLFLVAVPTFAVPVVPASAARKEDGGIEWQLYGIYSYDVLKFSTTRGDANFKGKLVGGGLQQRLVSKRGQGFATRGEITFRSGDNTANARSTSESESLSGSAFLFGMRIYASDLYIGAYGTFMPFKVTYSNSLDVARNSEQKYNGFGLGFEVGMDLFLGDTLFLSPRAEYQMYSAQPSTGATDAMRVSGYGLGVGLGVAF